MPEYKHVCMLPEEPAYFYSTPNSGACTRLGRRLRRLLLPADWHHGYATYIRSRKSLKQEQLRQVNTSHWAIWHPYSPMRFYWDCVALLINGLAFIYMPLQVFIPCSDPYDPYILFSDAIAGAEVCVNFLTGRVDENGRRVELSPRRIAHRYARGACAVHLLAALPLQLIRLFENCTYPTHTLFFVFKLLRVISARNAWINLHKQLKLSYILSVALTLLGESLLFIHWMTFLHYQVPVLCAHLYDVKRHPNVLAWLRKFKIALVPPALSANKYITNLYEVAGMCIGSGTTAEENPLEEELLLNATFGIIGLLFMIYCFTTLTRLVIYKRFDHYLYSGRLNELEQYMVYKRLPQSLQQKIRLFINYKFNGHYFNEASILRTVNKQIKQDMNMLRCRRLVLNVPVFQDLPIALINMIIFSLVQVLFMPGEVVVKYNHPGTSIYLISSGTVACMDAEGREVAHLKDGAYFGQRALLNPGVMRSATVIALEITEMYRLTGKKFQECLQLCPRLKRRLEQRARAAPPGLPAPPAEGLARRARDSLAEPDQ